ncbi:MAG: glycosyltransferase [Acidimicrobiales bacterium]|nr:glycosyltransferase [Acidimicrobiales bacterium]
MSDIHVAYILKQYPRLSETFILNEILGLENAGVKVSVHSLRHATEGRFHPAVADVQAHVSYPSNSDRSAVWETLRWLPGLRLDRLDDALAFAELLPAERRAKTVTGAIEVAARAIATGVDHIHAHFLTVAAHTAHIVHLLTGISYSVTAHAKDIYRHTVDWELAARVAGDAAAVVTVCDANLEYLSHRLDGSGANVVRIYNGLGPQLPPSAPEARTTGRLLGVGRLVEKKGFDLLIEAVALLAERRPEVECVIAGDGDQRSSLEALAQGLGVAGRVHFLGSVNQSRVAELMRDAAMLVAPCRIGGDGNQDALPTVLIEALAAGLPSVSTPVAGIPEIVDDGVEGRVVEAELTAIVEAIDGLLDDPDLLGSMSLAGPDKVTRRFDRASTIGQLVSTFEMAVATSRPALGVAS